MPLHVCWEFVLNNLLFLFRIKIFDLRSVKIHCYYYFSSFNRAVSYSSIFNHGQYLTRDIFDEYSAGWSMLKHGHVIPSVSYVQNWRSRFFALISYEPNFLALPIIIHNFQQCEIASWVTTNVSGISSCIWNGSSCNNVFNSVASYTFGLRLHPLFSLTITSHLKHPYHMQSMPHSWRFL